MKKLRYKLIRIVFFSVSGVFLAVLLILYVSLSLYNSRQADGMTQLISLNGGIVPEFQEYKNEDYTDDIPHQLIFNEESEFRTRYFIVYFSENEELTNIDTEHIASVSESTAQEMAEKAISDENSTGYLEHYRYRITEGDNTCAVIFLDCTETFASRNVTMRIVTIIAVLIIFLITLIFGFFSKYVVKPFEENAKRQKQFITDASHELKTPLSIISANAEVLQYKSGENNWTKNIIAQTKRMSKLIGDLLALSKMDEVGTNLPEKPVDLSQLTIKTVQPLQEVATQKHADMHLEIEDHIIIKGYAEQLQQLISVLTENAVKYVTQDGTIQISLTRSGKHAVFRIFNTAQIDEHFDCTRLFDRFYRPDNSRSSETGGHGIGLSIAKKVAIQHNGTLCAERTKDGICFIATLPIHIKLLS